MKQLMMYSGLGFINAFFWAALMEFLVPGSFYVVLFVLTPLSVIFLGVLINSAKHQREVLK